MKAQTWSIEDQQFYPNLAGESIQAGHTPSDPTEGVFIAIQRKGHFIGLCLEPEDARKFATEIMEYADLVERRMAEVNGGTSDGH